VVASTASKLANTSLDGEHTFTSGLEDIIHFLFEDRNICYAIVGHVSPNRKTRAGQWKEGSVDIG
jgi:hypothetical protein